MAEIARRSPLIASQPPGAYGANTASPAVTLAERQPAALLRLFARTNDGEFGSALRAIIKLELPSAPNTTSEGDGHALLWLAPSQWLLVCDDESSVILESQLEEALAGTTGTVVDVTHGYAAVEIAGACARGVLAKGVPVDLHASAFETGTCVQTCLADMNVLLHARRPPTITVYVGRSYAASLWEWLAVSAAEFGYRVAAPSARSDI
ncbi:MAG: sarcosine oxidase subunit gamma [Acidiferrobacterales bacterium]